MSHEEITRVKPEAKERWEFDQALLFVCERYPELKERIMRSLGTPQLSAHHTEGKTMESHLRLVVETLNDMAEGRFPDSLARETELCELLHQSVMSKDSVDPEQKMLDPDMLTYAFTHDIAKPDSLLIRLEGEKKSLELTLEEWQAVAGSGEPYEVGGKKVASISYYHPSKGALGQHGNHGADMLESTNVPRHLLTAIRKHEVAYQFGKINALAYQEHFAESGLTDEEQGLAIAASYADTMASLTPDGTPDLENFLHLAASRKNYLFVQSALRAGMLFRENDLRALLKQDRVLTREDIERYRIG